MHRTDGDHNVSNKFDQGSPPTTPPTQVDASVLNAWQEEIAHVIEGHGDTLQASGAADDVSTRSQLAAAVAPAFLVFGSLGLQSGGNGFLQPGYDGSGTNDGATEVQIPIPCKCTLKSVRAHMITAAGGTLQNHFVVRVNGSSAGTPGATIAAGAHDNGSAPTSVQLNAGDLVSILHTTPTGSGSQGNGAIVTVEIALA